MNLNLDLEGIELHVHLDGAMRVETVYELGSNVCKKTLEEFKNELLISPPYTLTRFLEKFSLVIPIMVGRKDVLTRMAFEFVEDCARRSGLCYVEARMAPHLLIGPDLDAAGVTMTVLDAFQRASKQFGVEARLLLTILRHTPEFSDDLLNLAEQFMPHGVVGIDLAGDDSIWASQGTDPQLINMFQQAKKRGIHRTVHCGENAPAESVQEAVDQLYTERIGHGYSVINDANIYNYVKDAGVHFECCPISSIKTGAVSMDVLPNHPITRLFQDGVNFSINTDDPIFTKSTIPDEIQYCVSEMKLPTNIAKLSNLNAAKSCFLQAEERNILIEHVKHHNKLQSGFIVDVNA